MRSIFTLLCLLCIASTAISQNSYVIGNKKIDLEEGDIVFRSGIGKESAFIRDFSSSDKTFSHAGILFKKNNEFYVYHMLGGIINFNGQLRKDKIEDFVRYPDNECFGVYHANLNKAQIARFKIYLDSIEKRHVVFDMSFRLDNKDSLYCTEMIIAGIKFATNNAFQLKPKIIDLTKTRYRYAFTGDKTRFAFYPIDMLQHSYFLKKKIIVHYPNYKNKQIKT